MPVERRKAAPPHSRPELVTELVSELDSPHKAGTAGVPDITEEAQAFGNALHVKVLWDKWMGVPREERGAIIIDAYQQSRSRSVDGERISVAMGLTDDEAQKLGMGR